MTSSNGDDIQSNPCIRSPPSFWRVPFRAISPLKLVIRLLALMLLVDYNLGYEGQVNPFFGDINGDGMVNVMDLISLIRRIMGYVQ